MQKRPKSARKCQKEQKRAKKAQTVPKRRRKKLPKNAALLAFLASFWEYLQILFVTVTKCNKQKNMFVAVTQCDKQNKSLSQ